VGSSERLWRGVNAGVRHGCWWERMVGAEDGPRARAARRLRPERSERAKHLMRRGQKESPTTNSMS
jgi:hypothetical protein